MTVEDALDLLRTRKETITGSKPLHVYNDDQLRMLMIGTDLEMKEVADTAEEYALNLLGVAHAAGVPVLMYGSSVFLDGFLAGILYEQNRPK